MPQVNISKELVLRPCSAGNIGKAGVTSAMREEIMYVLNVAAIIANFTVVSF